MTKKEKKDMYKLYCILFHRPGCLSDSNYKRVQRIMKKYNIKAE